MQEFYRLMFSATIIQFLMKSKTVHVRHCQICSAGGVDDIGFFLLQTIMYIFKNPSVDL